MVTEKYILVFLDNHVINTCYYAIASCLIDFFFKGYREELIKSYLIFKRQQKNRILFLKSLYYFKMHSLSTTLKTNDSNVGCLIFRIYSGHTLVCVT